MNNRAAAPVAGAQRHIFLDALRGFALLGVCLANFPEFSLYTFQPDTVAAALPWAAADRVYRFFLYFFIDGKFYTLFSLLFGIGFSIIISNAESRGANGFRIFYRRMCVLALIGFAHLMLLWSGDILMLYALLGMLLPLFRRLSDRKILLLAAVLLLIPVVLDGICALTGLNLAEFPYRKWWHYAAANGITEDNFGTWLRDAHNYREVFSFLIQGAWERMYEFVDGNRYFKVMGLFLIGFVAGRRKIYADLAAHRNLLVKILRVGLMFGIPLSAVYAISGVLGHPWGTVVHTVLYTVSVYPLGFAYAAALGLFCIGHSQLPVWRWFAAPGRMALTNYIGQSVIGIFIFYGIGLGLGASMGLVQTELVAFGVFLFEMLFSRLWLSAFRFGPLEWIWRMLTYGRYFPIIAK